MATFLALLELCKLKSVSVSQDDADDDGEVTFLQMPEETAVKE